MCGRNRFLVPGEDGTMLCPKCRESGRVPCPTCGQPYAAGYGKQCPDCYYRSLLDKKVELDLAGFETAAMKLAFRKYADWLLRNYGPLKAALVVNKHYGFFQDMEKRWGEVPAYPDLLAFHGAEGLRRRRLAMRFLNEVGIVRIDYEARLADSETRRVQAIVDEFEGSHEARLELSRYRDSLLAAIDRSEMKIRTARLYLRAAAGLLETAGTWPPSQDDLRSYLRRVPGQRASLARFVGWMRKGLGIDLAMPGAPAKKRNLAGNPRAEKKLARLIREAGPSASYDDRKILEAALAFYHGIPVKALRELPEITCTPARDGGHVASIGGREYWLPSTYYAVSVSLRETASTPVPR